MNKSTQSFSVKHWLNYIESLHPETINLSLERVEKVAARANLTDLGCPVVMVAGTNGKGSTVATLATILQANGLRVGAYFSPHLISFNERIVINGHKVPNGRLCQAFATVENLREQESLTFFEFTTLAALEIFKSVKLDVVILEVGLGGRLDAVNIVEPTISIVTSIGLDHTDRLGPTLDDIAREKAGIFRKDVPALICYKALKPALLEEAHRIGAKLYQEHQAFGWQDAEKRYWMFQGTHIKVPPRNLPASSVSLALAAAKVLTSIFPNLNLTPDDLSKPLREAQLPGRFQRCSGRVQTILDVAHNPLGAKWLNEKLKTLPSSQRLIGLWSSVKGKDLLGIVNQLKGNITHWIIAPINQPNGSSIDELKAALLLSGVKEETIIVRQSIANAYKEAYQAADSKDSIVVFGSFFTVSEVICAMEQDFIHTNTYYSQNKAGAANAFSV